MDSTPMASDSDPKTVCINYILQLAVSFRHFSNTNQIALELQVVTVIIVKVKS